MFAFFLCVFLFCLVGFLFQFFDQTVSRHWNMETLDRKRERTHKKVHTHKAYRYIVDTRYKIPIKKEYRKRWKKKQNWFRFVLSASSSWEMEVKKGETDVVQQIGESTKKKIPNQKKQKRKWLLGGNKSERFEQGSMTRVSYLSTMTYTYHIYMHKIEDLKKERDRRGGNSPCFWGENQKKRLIENSSSFSHLPGLQVCFCFFKERIWHGEFLFQIFHTHIWDAGGEEKNREEMTKMTEKDGGGAEGGNFYIGKLIQQVFST